MCCLDLAHTNTYKSCTNLLRLITSKTEIRSSHSFAYRFALSVCGTNDRPTRRQYRRTPGRRRPVSNRELGTLRGGALVSRFSDAKTRGILLPSACATYTNSLFAGDEIGISIGILIIFIFCSDLNVSTQKLNVRRKLRE